MCGNKNTLLYKHMLYASQKVYINFGLYYCIVRYTSISFIHKIIDWCDWD